MNECDVLIVGGGIAGASLGARLAGPARRLSFASKPMFDAGWPGSSTPLLRRRGSVHLTGPHGDRIEGAEELTGEHALIHLDRAALDPMIPGLRGQWTGAWFEASCADIEVAAFHAACLAAIRRDGGEVRTDAGLRSAARLADGWEADTAAGAIRAGIMVNAAGAWADDVAARCGVAAIGLQPMRRTVVQLRVGRTGLRDLPLVTDLHASFYFKGEGDRSVWVSPLDETPVDPCDAAPEEIDVAIAIDRFERAVDWPVEAVERKWAGLRSFAPGRLMKYGFDRQAPGFLWCAGQGGMGIQTPPAASLLCATLIRGQPLPAELAGIDPADFAPHR